MTYKKIKNRWRVFANHSVGRTGHTHNIKSFAELQDAIDLSKEIEARFEDARSEYHNKKLAIINEYRERFGLPKIEVKS